MNEHKAPMAALTSLLEAGLEFLIVSTHRDNEGESWDDVLGDHVINNFRVDVKYTPAGSYLAITLTPNEEWPIKIPPLDDLDAPIDRLHRAVYANMLDHLSTKPIEVLGELQMLPHASIVVGRAIGVYYVHISTTTGLFVAVKKKEEQH